MAEIKSTLDMVMERAARMCSTAGDSKGKGDLAQDGMRAGAAFLRGEDVDIQAMVRDTAPEHRTSFLKGMVETFLRNIVLPRDEQTESQAAFTGLRILGSIVPQPDNLAYLLDEMKTLQSHYIEHRRQLKKQLEDSFAMQMGRLEQNLAQQTGVNMKLEPSQHPKFAEEWQHVKDSLNEQYGNAMAQFKEAVVDHLCGGN